MIEEREEHLALSLAPRIDFSLRETDERANLPDAARYSNNSNYNYSNNHSTPANNSTNPMPQWL